MKSPKTYKSKVDIWIVAVLGFSMLLPLGLAVFFREALIITAIIIFPMAALIIWLFNAIKYQVGEKKLTVFGGFYKIQILLEDIKSVKATRNPLSSPALSLDRLEIRYGKDKTVLVSPKDKTNFLSDIGWIKPI